VSDFKHSAVSSGMPDILTARGGKDIGPISLHIAIVVVC
jgi:hypothetical protein